MATTDFFQQALYGPLNSVATDFCKRETKENVFTEKAAEVKIFVHHWSESASGYQEKKLDATKLTPFLKANQGGYRAFFIGQRLSITQLKITKELYETLVKERQVFPKFLQYLVNFRRKDFDTEIGPPRITFNPLPSSTAAAVNPGFEIAYVLRFKEFTNREKCPPYSLRKCAVYHKVIPSGTTPGSPEPCSTWILAGASHRLYGYFKNFLANEKDPHAANPFELHASLINIALEPWREYLRHESEHIKSCSMKAFCTDIEKDGSPLRVNTRHCQSLSHTEEELNDVLLCLDSTQDTLETLDRMYHRYQSVKEKHGSPETSKSWERSVPFTFENQLREVAYTRKKTQALIAEARSTREEMTLLITCSKTDNILQKMNDLQVSQSQMFADLLASQRGVQDDTEEDDNDDDKSDDTQKDDEKKDDDSSVEADSSQIVQSPAKE